MNEKYEVDNMAYMPYNLDGISERFLRKTRWIIMKTLNRFLDEQLKNEDFANEMERLKPEFDIIRAIVEARDSQHMTQEQLAKSTGINQADISKIENGTRNPSLNMLKRLANGMNMRLELKFIPKD